MMMESIAKNLKHVEADDAKWKEPYEKALMDKGGVYFTDKKKNVVQRYTIDLNKSTRGQSYQVKSRNVKKDLGYLIISCDDHDSVKFFAEEGCTASIPAQNYKQHIHWEADNRCKPDRGIFFSQSPQYDKVLFKDKPPLEGILVVIEYIKREAQFIHGTPYVWVPSDRDFFVPHCYPRAMIHYRDEKAPARPVNTMPSRNGRESSSSRDHSSSRRESSSSRDHHHHHRRERSRERDRYSESSSRSHRESDRRSKREYDDPRPSYESRDRRSNYDNYSSRRESSSSRDHRRGGDYYENGYSRNSSPPPPSSRNRRSSPPDRDRKYEHRREYEQRYESRRDSTSKYAPSTVTQAPPPPPQPTPLPSQSTAPPQSAPLDSRWPENQRNNGYQVPPYNRPATAPSNQQAAAPPSPRVPLTHPSPMMQNKPLKEPKLQQQQQSMPMKPKPDICVIPPRNHEEIKMRLKNRRKRAQHLWAGSFVFAQSKFELKAELLGYGNGVIHRLAENRLHFTSRLPTVYAGELVKIFSKSITQFCTQTMIKNDSLCLNGYWTAFPVVFAKHQKTQILDHAFGPCPVIVAKTLCSNLRCFLLKRDLLKNIVSVHSPGHHGDLFHATGEPNRYVMLIHSSLTGPCSGKELRDFQAINRQPYHAQPVYNISPLKFYNNLPQLSQTGVADCLRSISDAMSQLGNFSRQLEEFWRLDSEHYAEIMALAQDKLSAAHTNQFLTNQVFSADRHAHLLTIVKRKFNEREKMIREILVEQKRLKDEAIRRKQTNRPITPPPMAPVPMATAEQVVVQAPLPPPPPTMIVPIVPPTIATIQHHTQQQVVVKREKAVNGATGGGAEPPQPKVRRVQADGDDLLRNFEQQAKATSYALLKDAIPAPGQRGSSEDASSLRQLRFVNLITMRHKNATLPDMIGDERWAQWEAQLRSKRACRLPQWFFAQKRIRLGPDAKGDRVPIITAEPSNVKKTDLFEREPSLKKRLMLGAVPKPAPLEEVFQSQLHISAVDPRNNSTIHLNDKEVEQMKSFTVDASKITSTDREKRTSTSMTFLRVNNKTLQSLRLGKIIENVQNEQVGSDDEGDRKGATKEYIKAWIKDVNVCLDMGTFVTTLDGRRFTEGEWRGNYIDAETNMDDRNVVLANFQACTAIDDYSVCLAILEQHNWDLQNAVNAALTQSSTSADAETPAAAPTPAVQRTATLSFEVTSGATTKTINFDESGTVGTLLQVIASEFDMWGGESLQLSGWPNGAQPDPEIPLNLLDLPPTTKLRHQATASITSRWDDSPSRVTTNTTTSSSTSSSNPFQALTTTQASSSSTSAADPHRKYAHFSLKIHDIDNDDHHELKYPGVKKVRDIKNDVYSLTLIPVSRQVWRGWPSNVGDEKCLYELDTGESHQLQLKVDDNRPRQLPSSSQTAVDLNQARVEISDNDDSDEEDEEEGDDYGDDDDFPIEEMSTQPKSHGKVPLITDYSGDYSVGTMQFMQEFQLRFGEQTPIWYIGTMEDAAKEAYGSATKAMERKMLAVYIHNERSIQSNIFCAQILCSPSINTFLMEHCIVWGFDVTNLNNKQLIYSQIERMYGGRVAGQVKRMSDDEYPLIIVSHGKGSSHDVSELIMGNCNVDQVMTKLIVAKDQADVRKGEEHKAEMVREQRETEISNQESEYEKSLRADREKMRLEQEEKRKKEEQAEQKRCEEESARLHQAEMGEKLPDEPPPGKDVSTLRFRFPDGSMKSRRFKQTARLSVLFIYIGAEGFAESQHKLVRPMPRLDLSASDRTKSLAQLGLKQDQLIVESINEESDESDDSDDSMEE